MKPNSTKQHLQKLFSLLVIVFLFQSCFDEELNEGSNLFNPKTTSNHSDLSNEFSSFFSIEAFSEVQGTKLSKNLRFLEDPKHILISNYTNNNWQTNLVDLQTRKTTNWPRIPHPVLRRIPSLRGSRVRHDQDGLYIRRKGKKVTFQLISGKTSDINGVYWNSAYDLFFIRYENKNHADLFDILSNQTHQIDISSLKSLPSGREYEVKFSSTRKAVFVSDHVYYNIFKYENQNWHLKSSDIKKRIMGDFRIENFLGFSKNDELAFFWSCKPNARNRCPYWAKDDPIEQNLISLDLELKSWKVIDRWKSNEKGFFASSSSEQHGVIESDHTLIFYGGGGSDPHRAVSLSYKKLGFNQYEPKAIFGEGPFFHRAKIDLTTGREIYLNRDRNQIITIDSSNEGLEDPRYSCSFEKEITTDLNRMAMKVEKVLFTSAGAFGYCDLEQTKIFPLEDHPVSDSPIFLFNEKYLVFDTSHRQNSRVRKDGYHVVDGPYVYETKTMQRKRIPYPRVLGRMAGGGSGFYFKREDLVYRQSDSVLAYIAQDDRYHLFDLEALF